MPKTAMHLALVEAIPQAADRFPLSRQITTVDDVRAMADEQLGAMLAAHESEIAKMEWKLQCPDQGSHHAYRTALRFLSVHKTWIDREVSQRQEAERLRQAKLRLIAEQQARREEAERQRQARAVELAAQKDHAVRYVAVFQATALEVLGRDMYTYVSELARQRLQES